MSIAPATLKAELNADPLALGYAASGWVAPTNDRSVATVLNAPTTKVPTQWVGVVPGYQVMSAISSSEFLVLTSAQQNLVIALVAASGGVDTSNANVRAAFGAIFGAGTLSRAALLALATRNGSRCEQLFGVGVAAGESDVSAARSA